MQILLAIIENQGTSTYYGAKREKPGARWEEEALKYLTERNPKAQEIIEEYSKGLYPHLDQITMN